MSKPLRVLIIEDSVDDTFFIVRELQRGGFQVDFERVETAMAMREAMESSPWDLVISDYLMPQFDGASALALYKQLAIDIPFIVVSGAMGEELAVEMVKGGAHDYVKKENLARLVESVKRELEAARRRRARAQTETASSYLASLVQSCEAAIIGKTLEGTVLSWNNGAEKIYGYSPLEMIGRSIGTIVPAERQKELEMILTEVSRGGHIEDLETVRVRKDGSRVEVALTVSPVKDAEGKVIGASTVALDITRQNEEKKQHLALIEELTSALSSR